MAEELKTGDFQTKATPAKPPSAIFRRWMLEIELAGKRERNWRKTASELWDKYRAENKKKNSFNILWANTDAMLPLLFNTAPKPDVRRRWRSADPLGKAVSEVLERGATFAVDSEDFFQAAKADVIDMLVPGRGISRIRYIPSFKEVGAPYANAPDAAGNEHDANEAYEAVGEEELDFARVCMEHVDWNDFRHGPGRTWTEVPWVAFRCRVAKDEAEEKFGKEIADALQYDQLDDKDLVGKSDNKDIEQVFRTAELWEVWDKTDKKCFFIHPGYKDGPIYPKAEEGEDYEQGEPPLKFKGFFPCAMPLRAVDDSSSTLPIPLYEEYREQAEELDRISSRINKLVNGLKLRGIYDATISEFGELMKGQDNDLIPSETAARIMAMGGDLNKAIAWMPIEMGARVLKELYVAREACKQTIYEISGMADILRAQTDPNETLGAQQLKANFASVRMQRLQKEVQRYMRDNIRLMCEVIGECFDIETLQKMTGLQFPMAADKQQAGALLQQAQVNPQQADQQALQRAQQVMQMPTWEDIKAIISSDIEREYRVDIETDSTVAQTLAVDMQALRDVLTALVQFWEGAGPAVGSGALDVNAVKAISLQICRRAKLGLEVEDALETGIKPPNPQADPHQGEMALQAQKIQAEAAARKDELAFEAQKNEQQNALEAQREQIKANLAAQLEQFKAEKQAELKRFEITEQQKFEMWKAELDAKTRIEIAEIQAKAVLDRAQAQAARNETVQ